jgi:hypothetical protein
MEMGHVFHTVEDHAQIERRLRGVEKATQRALARAQPGTPEHADLTAQLEETRQVRQETNGRGPVALQQAAEASHAAHDAALRDVATAQRRLHEVEHARSSLKYQPRAARTEIKAQHAEAAREGGGPPHAATEARIRGAKEALRAAKAKAAELEEARIETPARTQGMRTAEGREVPLSEVRAHMAARGIEEPGFVSHQRGVAGRGSFYRSVRRYPAPEKYGRTLRSYEQGTHDSSWNGVAGSHAQGASKAAQLEAYTHALERIAVHRGDSLPELQELVDRLHHDPTTGQETRPAGEFKVVHLGSGEVVKANDTAPHVGIEQVLREHGLDHEGVPESERGGRYGVIKASALERLDQHDAALSAKTKTSRIAQLYAQGFRRAKLTTSVPHMFGVAQEQAIRLLAEQAGPGAHAAGRNVQQAIRRLAELDQHGVLADDHGPLGARFRQINSQIANRGGVTGSQRAINVQRLRGDQWQRTSSVGYAMHGVEGAVSSRGAELAVKPWHALEAVTQGNLTRLEEVTRNTLLGKALKDTGLIDSYRRLIGQTNEAMDAWVKGNITPQIADALAQRIDDMGGNWNRQTPAVRKVVGKYAPFGLWWLNSMRWLYRLPVTHPIKTAIAAALYEATRPQRNAKGQGFNAIESKVPSFLQGTVDTHLPLLGDVKAAPSYYSPAGIAGPEAAKTAVEQFGVAFADPVFGLLGRSPLSLEKLKDEHGKEIGIPAAVLNALVGSAAGPLPFATQAEKVLTAGGKQYGTANLLTDLLQLGGGRSQIKPGTGRKWQEVLGKLVAPTRTDFPSSGSQTGSPGSVQGAAVVPGTAASPWGAVSRQSVHVSGANPWSAVRRQEEKR